MMKFCFENGLRLDGYEPSLSTLMPSLAPQLGRNDDDDQEDDNCLLTETLFKNMVLLSAESNPKERKVMEDYIAGLLHFLLDEFEKQDCKLNYTQASTFYSIFLTEATRSIRLVRILVSRGYIVFKHVGLLSGQVLTKKRYMGQVLSGMFDNASLHKLLVGDNGKKDEEFGEQLYQCTKECVVDGGAVLPIDQRSSLLRTPNIPRHFLELLQKIGIYKP